MAMQKADFVALAQLSNKTDIARDRLEQRALLMDSIAKESAHSTISALESAMGRPVYKVAVTIRGKVDPKEPYGREKRVALLKSSVQFLEVAQFNAEQGLQSLMDIVELRHNTIAELKKIAQDLTRDFQGRADQLASEAKGKENLTADAKRELERQIGMTQEVMQKMADTKAARQWDFFGATKDAIQLLESKSKETYDTVLATHKRLNELLVSKSQTDQHEKFLRQVLAGIPPQEQILDLAVMRAQEVQDQAMQLKRLSSDMTLIMKKLYDATDMSTAFTDTKVEFAQLILELCHRCLVDSRLVDEVIMIRDEIFDGYVGPMDEDVKAQLELVNTRLQSFPAVISQPKRLSILGPSLCRIDTDNLVRNFCRGDDPKPGVLKVFTMLFQYEGSDIALLITKDNQGVHVIDEAFQVKLEDYITIIKEPHRSGGDTAIYAAIYGTKLITSPETYTKIWANGPGC